MKNISKVLVLLSLGFLLQDCTTSNVENDFSYESMSDSISESLFRNRKFEYARVKVTEKPSLIIPTGLNGEQIKPEFKLPEGNNNYARSQIPEAQQNMLPPNYTDRFNMSKIVDDQIAKVVINMVYDDTGAVKLVFREPLAITLNLLEEYFKKHKDIYTIISEKDEILSGHLITVKDIKKDLIFVIKSRKVDELSSLVKLNAVFTGDGKSIAPDHIKEGVKLLTTIRKELNNTQLKDDENLKLIQQVEAELAESEASSSKSSGSGSSSLGGLAGFKKKGFAFGSYDKTVANANNKQEPQGQQQSDQDYTQMTAPSGDSVYNSDTQAQELNT